MNKKGTLIVVVFFAIQMVIGQQKTSSKVILITLDGLRWQELFSGADAQLIENEGYVDDIEQLKAAFWDNDHLKRRAKLMPFIWSEVSKMGQLYGNRWLNSSVNLTNSELFSYPGYNEILSGRADDERITSNDKINNPNVTILEIINDTHRYKGKVAAFGSWDVFPYIINEERSGIPVNAGYEPVEGPDLSEKELLLNNLQKQTPKIWSSVRLDAFTHNFALEHMKKRYPEFIYISYGETDDFAHDGNYQSYLKSANRTDSMIKELWEFTQNDSFYKDNTIFVITTDHGRGSKPIDSWRSHGSEIKGADETWLVVFGNSVITLGEVQSGEQIYSTQIAPTVLNLFGVEYDLSIIEYDGIDVLKE